jgi:tRNA(Met) C34 N-acetyltransferase TmcA
MTGRLITSLLSLCSNVLPSIRRSAQAPSSSNGNSENQMRVVENLERLIRTLERIKATWLYDNDAEDGEASNHSDKLWLKELKEFSYDTEDILSEYLYEVTRVQVEARKASEASGSHKRKQMEVSALSVFADAAGFSN